MIIVKYQKNCYEQTSQVIFGVKMKPNLKKNSNIPHFIGVPRTLFKTRPIPSPK